MASERLERALRYNVDKSQLHFILAFPQALRAVADITTYGSHKYEMYNFLKGASSSESVSSLLRHLDAWWRGEELDPESKLHHLAHLAWNALRLCDEHLRGTSIDDRPVALRKTVVPEEAESVSEPDKPTNRGGRC